MEPQSFLNYFGDAPGLSTGVLPCCDSLCDSLCRFRLARTPVSASCVTSCSSPNLEISQDKISLEISKKSAVELCDPKLTCSLYDSNTKNKLKSGPRKKKKKFKSPKVLKICEVCKKSYPSLEGCSQYGINYCSIDCRKKHPIVDPVSFNKTKLYTEELSSIFC